MSNRSRVGICFVGPLPPPTHGMANVNAQMVARLAKRAPLRTIAVNPSPGREGVAYHLTKSLRALAAFPRILAARLAGARVYYSSVDDGAGGIWTGSFALAARALGYRVYLHHHSFRYLVRRSSLMAAIAWAAGPRAVHVGLCDDMAAALRRTYPAIREAIAVPNSVPLPSPAAALPSPRATGGELVVGMLSNLLFEKGVREFVEIVRRARRAGRPVRGILAGPAFTREMERFLADALAEPDLRLEWRGPLVGEAKTAFFRDIDLFVFPTRYRTEAYPLVLLEALVHGVPVVAPRRGCIGALAGLRSATIVPLEEDFVTHVLALLDEPRDRFGPAARSQAREDGETLNASNAALGEAFLARLTAPSGP
jgi:glycosyltransferase involved in cell wall biosynthesis